MDLESIPRDGGNLLLTDDEYKHLLEQEPLANKYLRPFKGSQEFLNNIRRWCLWFDGVDLLELN